MISGTVFDIQKFSVHDGPGIRTTVFLKGCPLHCLWCHNPESWQAQPELLFSAEKCTGCGACAKECPNGCHSFRNGVHHLNRIRCTGCGACAKSCRTEALELCGRRETAEEVLAEVLRDRPFYENSGGGMTLSGGEPLAQFAFSLELLKQAKANGLHTCLETCGYAPRDHYLALLPFTDLFLFDVKTVDAEKHRSFTGQDNRLILDNLRALDNAGAALHLRCPLIPGMNDSEAELHGIGVLANSLAHVQEIEVEPYHPLGVSKAHRLGFADAFTAPFTPKKQSDLWIARIAETTAVPVRKQ